MSVGNFTADFADWRKESVTISSFTSYDKFGTPSYGTGTATACYIEMIPKLINNTTGQQVVSNAQVYVIGNASLKPQDKVVLPDGKYPPVLRIDHFYNEVGVCELSVIYL